MLTRVIHHAFAARSHLKAWLGWTSEMALTWLAVMLAVATSAAGAVNQSASTCALCGLGLSQLSCWVLRRTVPEQLIPGGSSLGSSASY